MADASASLVRCDVRLTDTHLYPGDAVEGSVVVDAAGAFQCGNIHVKVVGKESVSVLVDQVSQSKTPNLQYGISAQDYVYYREVVTLAGPLITQKNEGTVALSAQRTGCSERGSNGENADTDEGDAADVVLYNESVCVRPGVAEQNQSFVISQMAAEEGVSVRFPAGHYVYPFRFRLPDALPPSYDTGMCVKDGQHSNSQAALRYYVKVYVKSPARAELASARADFVVGAMQPVDSVTFPPAVEQQESTKRSTALKAKASPSSKSSPSAPRAAAASEEKRCFVRQPSSSSGGRTVHCAFPTTGTCSCMSGGATLKVAFVTTSEACQIGRDCVAATCLIAANTTAKTLRGLKVELTQLLAFETAAARVTLRRTLLKAECTTAVPVGEGGTMTAHTAILEPSSDFIPSMKTSGLEVRYVLRVQLIASHVDGAFYEFDDVQLTGPVMAQEGKGAVSPPVGAMSFTALPRGRLTRREAYYAVPAQPCETPVIAELAAPLSVQGSRAASRRASRLNTLSAEDN